MLSEIGTPRGGGQTAQKLTGRNWSIAIERLAVTESANDSSAWRNQKKGRGGQDNHRHQRRGRTGQGGTNGPGGRCRPSMQRDQRFGRHTGAAHIPWSPDSRWRNRSWRQRNLGYSYCPAPRAWPMPTRFSASNRQRASTLRQQMTGELSRFDYIFIDCPPSLGLLTRAALGTSGGDLHPDPVRILRHGRAVADHRAGPTDQGKRQPPARNWRHRVDNVRSRAELANEVVDEVRQYFAETVFESLIPEMCRLVRRPAMD